mmetsp:Transcript_17595/g.36603  ORF Transcript_17595/g.36603 Transcript_17595/m.36603 type:complete len:317 (-) Transcript_17595:256-1206(-)
MWQTRHELLLLHEQLLYILIQPQIEIILMRQQIPRRFPRLGQRLLIRLIRIGSPRHEPLPTGLLIGRIDPKGPPEEFFESGHGRFDFRHESHHEFATDDFHGLGEVVFGEFSAELVGELAGHPIVFDDFGLGVLFEGPVFEFGFVGWFPVGYLDVVEHAYGSVDGMTKDRKEPPLRRIRKQIIHLVHERRDHHIRQSRIGKPHILRPLNPRHGRAIDVDEGTPIHFGSHPRNLGIDYGHFGILIVTVGDAEFGGLDEAMTSSEGVFDGGASGFGYVPEDGYVGFFVGVPGVFEVGEFGEGEVEGGVGLLGWWDRLF